MSSQKEKGVLDSPTDPESQARILRYLKGGRIHPAVILIGGSQTDRLDIARGVSKFLLCKNRSSALAFCGNCLACRKIDREVHPDYLIFRDADEDSIKIDSIRLLCQQMELTPAEGDAKICIVDEAQRMNHAAANAFLKTLEEPGPRRFFWLLVPRAGLLLPTLTSRCLKFTLKPSADDLASKKSERQPELEKRWGAFLQSKEPTEITSQLTSKEDALEWVHFLSHHYRDEALQRVNSGVAVTLFTKLLKVESRLRSNGNYGLMLESFLLENFQ